MRADRRAPGVWIGVGIEPSIGCAGLMQHFAVSQRNLFEVVDQVLKRFTR